MKYEDLKKEIQSIADIAASVPEAFRDRCFQVLLEHLLGSRTPTAGPTAPPQTQAENPAPITGSIPTPSQIKVLMQKTGLTEADLARVVLWEDDEVHFIREPTTSKVARGQIEWSLLLALKNGIASNSLSVDPEDVRSICQEKGFYDKVNFVRNFKTAKNAALFQKPMEKQGEPQKLTADGQAELARLVMELAASS